LTAALEPLKGRCGKGKGGLASGQVSNFYMVPAVNRSHLKLSTW